MPDENTASNPANAAPELPAEPAKDASSASAPAVAEANGNPATPPEPAKVAPTVTAVTQESKGPALSKNAAKETPAASILHEPRQEPRIRVKWHVDAIIDGQDMYKGFVKDISLHGTDIFLDVNLQKVKSLKVRIYVPPLSKKEKPHVMEVSGKVVYTAYDSGEFLFHTGVKFLQFSQDSDHALLQSRISLFNRAR